MSHRERKEPRGPVPITQAFATEPAILDVSEFKSNCARIPEASSLPAEILRLLSWEGDLDAGTKALPTDLVQSICDAAPHLWLAFHSGQKRQEQRC